VLHLRRACAKSFFEGWHGNRLIPGKLSERIRVNSLNSVSLPTNEMERQRTVLVVDDDRYVRQALEEALVEENYQVASAGNGAEAMRHLREPRSEVDAVLLDLRLGPENGWNVLCRLTALQPGVPIILMSGTRGTRAPRLPGVPVTVLEKPLDLRRLFKTLRDLTAESEPVQPPNVLASRGARDCSAP